MDPRAWQMWMITFGQLAKNGTKWTDEDDLFAHLEAEFASG
jgi:hypothetical protein